MSVGAIIDKAGISRPRMYQLYPSKEALFSATVEQERLRLIAKLTVPISRGGVTADSKSLTDACAAIGRHVGAYHRTRPHSLRLVFGRANWRLATQSRREVHCLLRLAVEEGLAPYLPKDVQRAGCNLGAAVTTCILAMTDLVDEARMDFHEASEVTLLILRNYAGAFSTA